MATYENEDVVDIAHPWDELLVGCITGEAVGQFAGFSVGGVKGFGEQVALDQPL
jgi:outer membrane lipoprotein SlyB